MHRRRVHNNSNRIMRFIFIFYWVWYLASMLLLMSNVTLDLFWARIFAVSMHFNMYFVCIAPIYNLIYSRASHKSDQKFLNACLFSALIRAIIWCFALYGLTDHKQILLLNGFGMFVFILIERKLKKISAEYFNH